MNTNTYTLNLYESIQRYNNKIKHLKNTRARTILLTDGLNIADEFMKPEIENSTCIAKNKNGPACPSVTKKTSSYYQRHHKLLSQ